MIVTETNCSLYLNNRPYLAYGYEVPGTWALGTEPGLLRSVDGSDSLGVLLLSDHDLKDFNGPTLIARAARWAGRRDERHEGFSAELSALEIPRFTAMRWKAHWVHDAAANTYANVEKVFLDIAQDWVVQVTPPLRGDPAYVLRRLAETLGTTANRAGYLPYAQARYPGFFPEGFVEE